MNIEWPHLREESTKDITRKKDSYISHYQFTIIIKVHHSTYKKIFIFSGSSKTYRRGGKKLYPT